MRNIKEGTQKIKRKYVNLDWLDKETIRPYLKMNQETAAAALKVSPSTLKRYFYNLDMGRWPSNRKSRSLEEIQKSKLQSSNKSICGIPVSHLLNITIKNEKDIDENTWKYLTTTSFVNKIST